MIPVEHSAAPPHCIRCGLIIGLDQRAYYLDGAVVCAECRGSKLLREQMREHKQRVRECVRPEPPENRRALRGCLVVIVAMVAVPLAAWFVNGAWT